MQSFQNNGKTKKRMGIRENSNNKSRNRSQQSGRSRHSHGSVANGSRTDLHRENRNQSRLSVISSQQNGLLSDGSNPGNDNDSPRDYDVRPMERSRNYQRNGPSNSWRPSGGSRPTSDNLSSRSILSSEHSDVSDKESHKAQSDRQNGRTRPHSILIVNRHEDSSWRRNVEKLGKNNSSQASQDKTGSSKSKKTISSTKTEVSSSSNSSGKAERSKNRVLSSSSGSTGNDIRRRNLKIKSEIKKPSPPRKNNGNEFTKQSSASQPAAAAAVSSDLPSDWILQKSKSTGKTYYYNTKTKKSSWVRPEIGVEPKSTASISPAKQRDKNVSASSKRKKDEMLSSPNEIRTEKTKKVKTDTKEKTVDLLGSPISDDDGDKNKKPKEPNKMEISDTESVTSPPSKHAATSSSPTDRPRLSNLIQTGKRPPDSIPSTAKRSKAPTVDDLRKLNESQENRGNDKLQRVEKWRCKLESPLLVAPSPAADDISLSPVSSDGSLESHRSSSPRRSESPVPFSPLQLESSHALPSVSCPSPLPPAGISKIALPSFDLPDMPDLLKIDLSLLNLTASVISPFRSIKIDIVEDQRCKRNLEAQPALYCRADEKAVFMKSNIAEVTQRKIVSTSETEHITFLNSFEQELEVVNTPRNEPKPDGVKSAGRETTLMELKTDIVADPPELKIIVTASESSPKGVETLA